MNKASAIDLSSSTLMRCAAARKCQSSAYKVHMKGEPLKVYKKPQAPLPLIPAGKPMSELVKIVETPLSKADYDQILAAKNLSSAPLDAESVAEVAELHFRLSIYAPGGERGLILVRRGGWRIGRDGKINIKCRYVPLAGNETQLPATVTALVKQYDWSKELIVCTPAKQSTGRCLRMTGLQPASYPELVRQRFLSDATDTEFGRGDVLLVQGDPPNDGEYVCLAKNGDIVRLQGIRMGRLGKVLGLTTKVVELNVRHCEITPVDLQIDLNVLPDHSP